MTIEHGTLTPTTSATVRFPAGFESAASGDHGQGARARGRRVRRYSSNPVIILGNSASRLAVSITKDATITAFFRTSGGTTRS